MSLVTRNIEAQREYTAAIELYGSYVDSKERSFLSEARSRFENSIRKDPQFFLPKYYRAVVQDIMGEFKDAAAALRLLTKTPPKQFESLVKFALGIALYHHYEASHLKEAVDLFAEIEQRGRKEAQSVRNLAIAGKLQAQAVLIMLEDRTPARLGYARNTKKLIEKEAMSLISEIKNTKKLTSQDNEALWIAYNSLGLAYMYVSDAVRYSSMNSMSEIDKQSIEEEFVTSEKYFKEAEKIAGPHWAIRSNLGSLKMRKAKYHFLQNRNESEDEFQSAIDIFDDILQNVRPDYDFAYYEKGKTYRYWHKYPAAVEMFMNCKEAGRKAGFNLDIARIDSQIEKAKSGIDTF